MKASSNELRVFISSTFRDLQEEREHLMKKIFPEIRSLCRERGITFTEVDLRWGLTEEEASLGRIIRTCLEEVDKCRPYFIGMIGNRYGWVPEFHEILMDPDLLAKYPWIEEMALEGASVTEMEFVHGVFDAPEVDGVCAHFYHRTDDKSDADDPERLAALIERARATAHPFRDFGGSEELGEMVREDLLAMIKRYWPQSQAPSALELERQAHSAFAASRVRAYIPNPTYLKEFIRWMTESERPLIVGGASGLGKSSLVAYLVEYYRKKNPTAFVVEHYVGASNTGGSAVSVMRHVIAEICDRFGIEETLPTTQEEIEKSFANWLFRAEHLTHQAGIPMLIVVDALNQLDESSQRLTWLPKTIPAGVKLMISTTPGETAERLSERAWGSLEVTPLEDERVRQSIVVRYLGEFHKGISPEQLRRMTSDAKASSPLYLRVVAEELRLHGEHGTVDTIIARYSSAVNLLEVFERVLERLENDYGVEGVKDLLRLLWASRAGLSETELLALTKMPRLTLSQLLFALDYHLIRHDGLLGFFHDYLRRAVEKRYVEDLAQRRGTHLRIAAYFEQNELSLRSARELLWQYVEADEDGGVVELLGRLEVLHLLYRGSGEYEVLAQWSRLRALGHDPEAIYRASVEGQSEARAPEERMTLWTTVAILLERLGNWSAAIEITLRRLDVARAGGHDREAADAEKSIGGLLRQRGEYAEALERLEHALSLFEGMGDRLGASQAIGTMGLVYANRGEYDRALECFQRQLTIAEELGDRRNVSYGIGNIGVVYYSRGEYDRALECYERQLTIVEELGNRIGVSMANGNMGNVYSCRGEYDRALECYERQLTIAEELGDRNGISMAISNMGLVYYYRGEYDRALECHQRKLTVAKELDDRHGVSQAIGSIGNVYGVRGEYDRGLECYERALQGTRELGARSLLSGLLRDRASLLLKMIKQKSMPEYLPRFIPGATPETWPAISLRTAREDAEECVAISTELQKPDTLFSGNVLLARLDAAEGRRDGAMQRLNGMLHDAAEPTPSGENAEDPSEGGDEEHAELHYWLWKLALDPGVEHRAEALRLYEQLLAKTPKYDYRKRIEELFEQGHTHVE